MKKLIPGLLSMLLCLGMATGCDAIKDKVNLPDIKLPGFLENIIGGKDSASEEPDSSSEDAPVLHAHEKDLKDVKDYLQGIVNEMSLETRKNFTLINSYSFFGETAKYDIAWSASIDGVTVQEGETEDTIVIGELEEDTPYVLTATITDPEGCHTVKVEFEAVALKALSLVPTMITAKPVENTAYKLYVYQSTLAKDLYFNGNDKAATYYFGTTENYEEGVDVYAEYIEGTDNFNLTFTYEGVKKYIGVRLSDDGAHDNIVATTEPVSSFFWSEELQTVLTHLDKNKNGEAADYYMGNYSSKDTISLSMTSYAGGAGNNIGGLATMVSKDSFTPEVKIATELERLSIGTTFIGADSETLPSAGVVYSDVAINWTVKSGDSVTIANNVLTTTAPAADTTAVITATLTCGDVTETKEFTISIKAETEGPAMILNQLYALKDGETLTGEFTLTGKITKLDSYNNPTIVVDGYEDMPVYCYRLKVENAVGDYITVTAATMKNYQGTYEFMDCTLVTEGGEEGGDEGGDEGEVSGNVLNIEAYATANGWADGTLYASVTYGDFTVSNSAAKPNQQYGQNTGKYYVSDQSWRIYQAEEPSLVITAAKGKYIVSVKISYISNKTGVLTLNNEIVKSDAVVTVNAKNITFGVGNSGTATNGQARITAIEVICADGEGGEAHEHSYGEGVVTAPTCTEEGYTTYTCECGYSYTADEVPATGHTYVDGKCACGAEENVVTPDFSGELVASVPVAGKAYIFGMTQENCNNQVYYLAGGMNGYYMETTTDASKAIVTYIEETTGGYYFYTYENNVKTYINMVVSGTHVNGKYDTTASTVYTIDEANKTLIAVVNDADYWFGTRNDKTYTTMGPCAVSYAGFFGVFYAPAEGGETPAPHEHVFVEGKCECGEVDPNYTPVVPHEHVFVEGKCECGEVDPNYKPEVETPAIVAGKPYIFGMTQANINNQIYYLKGGMDGYYMATTTDASAAISTYVEETTGGYYFYTYVGDVKTYINMVVSGTHVNGAYQTTASTVYTLDAEKMTLIAVVNGEDYWFGTRNDKTYDTMGPCKVSYAGFYGVFYAVEGGETPAPHEHSYEAVVTAPTCTEAGYTTYTCECGDSYKADEVAATGHTYVEGKCACGAEDPDYEAHVHNYEAVVTAPTCTVAGFTTYTCACGDSYTADETAVVDHVDTNLDITCDFEGCTKRILPPADSKISLFTANHMIIVSLNSNYYVEGVVTEVTNAGSGIFVITDEEGDTLLVRLPKDANGNAYTTFNYRVVVGDTVQVYGKPSRNTGSPTEVKAKVEGGLLEVLKHEHNFSEPTCTEAAVCACLAVGDPALGHLNENDDNLCDRCQWNLNLKISNIVVATDTTLANGVQTMGDDGKAAAWTWEDDNFSVVIAKGTSTVTLYTTAKAYMQLKKQNTLTVTNKNGAAIKSITISATNATQLTNLEKALVNNNLTFTKDESTLTITIEWNSTENLFITNNSTTTAYISGVEVVYEPKAAAHEHSYEAVVTAPTCTAAGFTTYTCACGDNYTADEVAATGHTYVDGKCACGAEDPEYVAPHEHSYEAVVTAPTCTAAGYTTYTCECGDSYTADEVAAIDHADEDANYKCDGCAKVLEPAADSTLTIPQATTLGKLYASKAYSTNKYYMTVIIESIYNTQYGNANVVDEAGNKFVIYGMYSADGKTRYDALSYKPVKGDEITVYGVIGNYNGNAQMSNGWLAQVVAHEHNYTSVVTAPTCTADGYTTHTCSICDNSYTDSVTEALGHTTENGTCENCGQEIGGETVAAQYVKVTSADEFTTGTYVLIVGTKNITVSSISGSWVKGSSLTAGDTIEKSQGDALAITLEVTDSGVKIKIGGSYIKPKGGNNNGIATGDYTWAYEFQENGTIIFKGVGSDTVYFAYNVQSAGFRGYKTSTVNGNKSAYPYTFTAYKLVG